MNVIYLHAHDAGRYIQPYGYAVETPNLMQLAREGTLFRHAYCAAPTCTPSRVAMLTGMSAHEAGVLGLAHRGFELKSDKFHLAKYMGDKGYETVLCGVQHEFRHDQEKPYDHILEAEGPTGNLTEIDISHARAAASFIQNRESEKPFFLSCGFILPHRDFPKPDEGVNPDYLRPPACLPDTPETRYDMAEYMAAVTDMDEASGIVLDAVKKAGLENDTMIIFTVDHGIAFPWMKCNLYDEGMSISLIIKYPGNPTAGKACDAMVSHLDVYPTVCDLQGLERPEWITGKSLRPLLEGSKEEIRDEVFAEVTFHAAYEPMRCIRTKKHKLIRYFDSDLRRPMANCDNGPSKSLLMEHGYKELPYEPAMLFDLMLDPMERRNLYDKPEYKMVQDDLEMRLRDWMVATNDPLLKGPAPIPRGARVNTRESINPADGDESKVVE